MAKVRYTQTDSGIEAALNGMLNRTHLMSSYLNRNLMRSVQKAQIERWQTENTSQTGKWAPLDLNYVKWKRKRFAAAPGGGNVIMIRSGNLQAGATGRDANFYYKLVTDKSFEFGINLGSVPYANYPSVLRPYMSFKGETLDSWVDDISRYLATGRAT